MQSPVFFYVDMQGKGKSPLPLHSIPKTNNNSKTKSNNKTKTKNKIKVVYTEDLTHRAGFALAVSMWGVSAAPVDAPMNKHGPIVRLLFALVVPAMVYFFFVLHGGQRAAFDRSFSRLVPCPSCQNSVKSLPPEAGCTTTTTHFAEPECPHCGHELS